MKFILILYWYGVMTNTSGKAALAVEFDDLGACQGAIAAIAKATDKRPDVAVCVPKGLAK